MAVTKTKPSGTGRGKKRAAINPPARRAVNLEETGDEMPKYERHARNFVEANKAKNAQAKIEKDEFAACWMAMTAVEKARFEFDVKIEGKTEPQTYVAEIAGDEKTEVDSTKLYELFKAEEITEAQFLQAIKCTQGDVKSACGQNVLMKVSETVPQEAKLTIKPKK